LVLLKRSQYFVAILRTNLIHKGRKTLGSI
jgi:hypothetical protein